MKKSLLVNLFLLLISWGISAQTAIAPSVGDGSSSNPYEITTLENLYWISANTSVWDKHFIQTADIDASVTSTWSGGGWIPIGKMNQDYSTYPFKGSYDGKNFTIKGLTINRPSSDDLCTGLFGMALGANLQNIRLLGPNIYVNSYAGSLGGRLENCTVKNCHVTGSTTVEGGYCTGGLAGLTENSIVSDCHSSCSVIGSGFVGGMIGSVRVSTITFCNSSGDVGYNTATTSSEIGGFVGNIEGSTLSKNFSTGNVNASGGSSSGFCTGGFVGWSSSNLNDPYQPTTITDCYSSGNVNGGKYTGGFVGNNYAASGTSTIANCYSRGVITGEGILMGFVADNSGTVNNCYFDAEVDGLAYTVSGGNWYGAIGKSTVEMKTQSTYIGWDFTAIWGINETTNDGYPYLLFSSACTDASITLTSGSDNQTICAGTAISPIVYTIGGGASGADVSSGLPDGLFGDYNADTKTYTISGTPTVYGTLSFNVVTTGSSPCTEATTTVTIEIFGYSGGDGSEGNPFQIATLADLRYLSESDCHWNKYFIQTADIDATDTKNWNSGAGWSPIGNSSSPFAGNYDGQGHTISELYIKNTSFTVKDFGLFGKAIGATFQNLGITGANISVGAVQGATGALLGWAQNVNISNCYSTGVVTANYLCGGLVGNLLNISTLHNCYSTCDITGYQYVGGLAGKSESASMNYCFHTGTVNGNLSTGGLVGLNSKSSVSKCYATGQVTGVNYLGGLVGENNSSTISNSYSRCDVSRIPGFSIYPNCGGLAGLNTDNGIIDKCYSTGSVETNMGGLVGSQNSTSTTTISFWDTETSGTTSSTGGTGITTEEMKTKSTFTDAGWDFTTIWGINPELNDGYLSLKPESGCTDGTIELAISSGSETQTVCIGSAITPIVYMVGGGADNATVEGLPDGVTGTYENGTFTISGTPTESGTFDFIVNTKGTILPCLEAISSGTITVKIIPKAISPAVGDGSAGKPYQITTLENLYWIANNSSAWDKNFIQTTDIDASKTADWCDGGWFPIGDGWNNEFSGNYDGLGHTISGLTISNSYAEFFGLFSETSGATIQNLGVINVEISGATSPSGGLVGYARNSIIDNCFSTGNISGTHYVGGLAGIHHGSKMFNCHSSCTINGTDRLGGIIGENRDYSTVTYCYSLNGNVSGSGNDIGGLVGSNHYYSPISNCYSTGGTISGNNFVGGLVGNNVYYCIISNCFSRCTCTSTFANKAGGLVGANYAATISNCYSTGYVGPDMYGLLAENYYLSSVQGTVSNSYWDTQTSGTNLSDGGTPKTIEEMKTESTFTAAGWDFTNIWGINGSYNDGYPYLIPATLTLSSGSDIQIACASKPITPIVYAVGGFVSGVSLSTEPASGLTGIYDQIAKTFTISGTLTEAGTYTFRATTTSNITLAPVSEASVTGTITVNPLITPSVNITSSNINNRICAGDTVTFTAHVANTGNGEVTYQWKLNNGNIGSNQNVFETSNLNYGDKVTCLISITGGTSCLSSTSAESNEIINHVYNNEEPSVSITPNPLEEICYGTNVTFSAIPEKTGGGTVTYRWYYFHKKTNKTYNYDSWDEQTWSPKDDLEDDLEDGDVVYCEITVTDAACFPSAITATSDKITISVTPYPDAGVITVEEGDNIIQVNEQITLNSTLSGGMWVCEDDIVSVDLYTGQVTGLKEGTATIYYGITIEALPPCYYTFGMSEFPITVTSGECTPPVPTFTESPTSQQCINNEVTYATQADKTNYVWDISGTEDTDYEIISGGTSLDNSVTLIWLTGGSKTVTVNYTEECEGITPASSTITVNPLPTLISFTVDKESECEDELSQTGTVTSIFGGLLNAENSINLIAIENGITADAYTGDVIIPQSELKEIDGYFYFETAMYRDPGSYQIILNSITANGCTNTFDENDKPTVSWVIHPLPVVDAGTYAAVCVDGTDVELIGTPTGGTWSGTGVTGNYFDPSVGTQTVTYTYEDVNGCSNSDDALITVNQLPTVDAGTYGPVCEDADDVALVGSPPGGVWEGAGVSGNQTDGYIFDPAGHVGDNILTYTYTDGNNCLNSDQAIIHVNFLPLCSFYEPGSVDGNPVLPGSTHYYATHGSGSFKWTIEGNGRIKGYDDKVLVEVIAGENCNEPFILSLTVNNLYCSSTCSKEVNVNDTEVPFLVDDEVTPASLNISGVNECLGTAVQWDASVLEASVAALYTDNCGTVGATYTGKTAGAENSDCSWTFTYHFTIQDGCFNSTTCDVFYSGGDNENPVAVCQDIKVQLDETGYASIADDAVNNGSSDNCSSALSFDTDITSFGCSNVGANTVVLTVTDDCNLSSTCNAMVIVEDKIAPEIICAEDITQTADEGKSYATITVVPPTVTDCDNHVLPVSNIELIKNGNFNSGDSYWENCGNTAEINTEEFYIVPEPPQSSNFVAEVDKVVSLCQEISGFTVGNKYVLTFKASRRQNTGTPNPVSANVVIDGGVLSEVVTRTNTAFDLTPESFEFTATQPTHILTFKPNTNNIYTIGLIVDDISVRSITYPIGTTTLVWTTTDVSGNTATCEQHITVSDNEPPSFTAPEDVTIQCSDDPDDLTLTGDVTDEADNFGFAVDAGQATYSDDESGLTGCNGTGSIIRTWSLTDATGITSTHDQIIIVQDNTNPTATAPAGYDLECADDLPDAAETIADFLALDGISTAEDNCTTTTELTVSHFDVVTVAGNCSGVITRTYTITDGCNNSVDVYQVFTVTDNTPPTAICKDIEVTLGQDGTVTIEENAVNNGSSDKCSSASDLEFDTDVTSFDCTKIGVNQVEMTVTDECGNSSTCKAVVKVLPYTAATEVSVLPDPQQYSDKATFTATVTPASVASGCVAATHVTFWVGTQQMGPAVALTNGTVSIDYPLTELPSWPSNGQMAPDSHEVTAVFSGVDPAFIVPDAATTLTITQEDVIIDYIGTEIVGEANPDVNTTPVILRATITDNYMDDDDRGDIRNARVRFEMDGSPISGWLEPTLVNPADATQGIVSYVWDAPVPSSGYATYDITVNVGDNGYYKGSLDDVPVNVYRTSLNEFITGGGHIIPVDSKGEYASDPGRKVNFGFNVKWNKTMKNLQGNFNLILRRGSEIYQIKSNALSGLGIDGTNPCSHKAVFSSKANLNRVTGGITETIMGNLILQITLTDNGEPGVVDRIGVTLYNGSTLLYSSSWPVSSTEELTLVGGNILVHDGLICNASDITHTVITSGKNPSLTGEDVTFSATVYGQDAIPEGTLVFTINGETFDGTLDSKGSTIVNYSFDEPGTYEIEADYISANGYKPSTGTITQLVNGSSFILSSSKNPSVSGDEVTFTAVLNCPDAAPAGTVTFKADGEVKALDVPLADKKAMFTTNLLSSGLHTIEAVYTSTNVPLIVVAPATLTQVVNEVSISLASSKNPSVMTETVVFTATVTGSASIGKIVTFFKNGSEIGTANVDVSGNATVSHAFGTTGTYVISAECSGKSVALSQVVTNPVIVLVSSKNPSAENENVTFTATVTGASEGAVRFTNGTDEYSTILTDGKASWTISLTEGSYLIKAEYYISGNLMSEASLTQVVTAENITVELVSSSNPSTYGRSVTFTATVVGSVTPPAGTITFRDGDKILKSVSISGDKASFSINKLSVGSHTIKATYDLTGDYDELIQVVDSKTKAAEIATEIKPEVELIDLKVYPNPFSEKLRFEFVSPESVDARIDLYDMTGRLVKNIFEQPIEGGTRYEAEFRPDAIISAIYFYRVILGDAIYNGKVIFKKE